MDKETIPDSDWKKNHFDAYLTPQLDSLVYNIKNDWDFVILITGDRMVRTGKSVLAMNICSYLSKRIGTPYTLNNVFMESKTMMKESFKLPKHSIIHYDEGAETLRKGKSFNSFQYKLIDYFNEVGQMNHIFVIVLPDFFDLIESIAVARTEFLINVYRTEEKKMLNLYGEGEIPIVKFGRGRFIFYNRERKRNLYDLSIGSKKKSYNLVKGNFFGKFLNYYPLNEQEYRNKKMEVFKRFEKRKEEQKDNLRDLIIAKLNKQGMTPLEIGKHLKETYKYEISHRYVQLIVRNAKIADELMEDEEIEGGAGVITE